MLVFISGQSTTAKFYMCYKIVGTPVLGFENLILSFDKLQEVVGDPDKYEACEVKID